MFNLIVINCKFNWNSYLLYWAYIVIKLLHGIDLMFNRFEFEYESLKNITIYKFWIAAIRFQVEVSICAFIAQLLIFFCVEKNNGVVNNVQQGILKYLLLILFRQNWDQFTACTV